MKTTRNFPTSPRRRAMTLIEIMAAILVLSIGLVGVLAAIPFGGFRMEQMQEADCAAALGRNAVRMMKANGWAKPDEWNWFNRSVDRCFANSPYSILDTGKFNLTQPFFVDPLGKMESDISLCQPSFSPSCSSAIATGGYPLTITRVFPRLAPYGNYDVGTFDKNFYRDAASPALCESLLAKSMQLRERNFYLQDDIFYGVSRDEDATEFRPRLEVEDDKVLNSGAIPAFSGRYSWLATVSLQPNTSPFYDCPGEDVALADFDVAVFKDRIIGDEKAFKAVVEGSGYQGGSVSIDLTNGRGAVDNWSNALDNLDRERVVEQLSKTRYMMLIGNDDGSVGNVRAFAKWYRIANYSVVASDNNGPATVRLTLTGPNTPANWANRNGAVTALFFPGVIGVYSSSTTF